MMVVFCPEEHFDVLSINESTAKIVPPYFIIAEHLVAFDIIIIIVIMEGILLLGVISVSIMIIGGGGGNMTRWLNPKIDINNNLFIIRLTNRTLNIPVQTPQPKMTTRTDRIMIARGNPAVQMQVGRVTDEAPPVARRVLIVARSKELQGGLVRWTGWGG